MSFQLGSFLSDDVVGFRAILEEWPVLPTKRSLDELPGGDGSLYYRSTMRSTEWVFSLELTATSLDEVLQKADAISLALNPKLHGLQDFTPNPLEGWTWKGVLAAPVTWERDKVLWFGNLGVSRLRGQLVVSTPNPYGYSQETPVSQGGPGTLVLTGGGTTSFFPRLVVRGVLPNDTSYVSVGGTSVKGPLTALQEMVLDFETLEFYIRTIADGVKLRNVADRITAYSRLEGLVTLSVPVSVTGGTISQVTGYVQSRRI